MNAVTVVADTIMNYEHCTGGIMSYAWIQIHVFKSVDPSIHDIRYFACFYLDHEISNILCEWPTTDSLNLRRREKGLVFCQ